MFSHPVTMIGFLLIIGGALVALFGGGGRYDSGIDTTLLGASLEALGFFMILMGVIAQGFLRIERYLAGVPAMKAAFDSGEPAMPTVDQPAYTGGANSKRILEMKRELEQLRERDKKA